MNLRRRSTRCMFPCNKIAHAYFHSCTGQGSHSQRKFRHDTPCHSSPPSCDLELVHHQVACSRTMLFPRPVLLRTGPRRIVGRTSSSIPNSHWQPRLSRRCTCLDHHTDNRVSHDASTQAQRIVSSRLQSYLTAGWQWNTSPRTERKDQCDCRIQARAELASQRGTRPLTSQRCSHTVDGTANAHVRLLACWALSASIIMSLYVRRAGILAAPQRRPSESSTGK